FVDVNVHPIGRHCKMQRGYVLRLRILAELRTVGIAPLPAVASKPEAVPAWEVSRRERPVGQLRAPDLPKPFADRRGHRQIEGRMRRLLRAASFSERVESVRRLGNAQLVD